jgi:uncharacterized membrane protein HdeD (DUF308 family)
MIVALIGNWKTLALGGAAAVLFGLLTLVWPDVTLWALVVLFGAWAFVDGGFRLVALATGVPGPGAGALVITWLIGWFALLSGTLRLALAWKLRKLEKGTVGLANGGLRARPAT